MTAIAFEEWPKIARLNRGMVVTEKLDGTNAAVVILPLGTVDYIDTPGQSPVLFDTDKRNEVARAIVGDVTYIVFAQSRSRFITPGDDNYGFAAWVKRNAEALVLNLGEGRHFGEWWGSGIQRRYGLTGDDKRFSLFNTSRWDSTDLSAVPGLHVVPVLARANFSNQIIAEQVDRLREQGSVAVPGFMSPEGVVVYLSAARSLFKVTLEKDDQPKSLAVPA